MHVAGWIAVVVFTVSSAAGPGRAQVRGAAGGTDPHSGADWKLIAPHLPDPVTANAASLEMAGDVLRARRFPSDALTYYRAAVMKGGDAGRLLKKEGVTHLEMQHGLMARLCFQQAEKLNKRDAEAWNDLGAADFMLGNAGTALGEYKRAVKFKRESAVFHSNLALAYFEMKDTRGARRELARALELDPEIMHHSSMGGYTLQVLASQHYAEICVEMARVSAGQGDRETAVSWLTKASERGLDVRAAIKDDPVLGVYLQDEQVSMMLANAQSRHKEQTARVKPVSLGSGTSGEVR